MKSALLITYTFPPFKTNSQRTYFIFKEWKKYFQEVNVITTSNRIPFIPCSPSEYSSSDILTAKTIDYRTFRLKKNRTKQYSKESSKSSLKFKLYNLLNSFPFNILAGEGGLIYTIHGFILGNKFLNKNPNSLILSSFRPYSDHIIAYLLKLKHPKVFWIADFRDLHIDPVLNELYLPKFQLWCNKKILCGANLVTTVSKGLANHLKPIHNKVVVLSNGIGIETSESIIAEKLSKFTITYTGSMFRDLRRPNLLLKELESLINEKKLDRNKINIKYAGKDTNIWIPLLKKYNLLDIFKSYGTVSNKDALELQKNTHINLILTYATPALQGNATGKLYEYLNAGQPIILLINGVKDEELEDIMKSTKAGIVAYDNHDVNTSLKPFLKEKYLEWQQTGEVEPTVNIEALTKYRWENMMSAFLEKHVLTDN